MAPAIENTRDPFTRALPDLLRDRGVTDSMGNPNLHAFAAQVDVSYESLRRTLAGERPVTPRIMEVCAESLGLEPTYFAEYRIYLAHREFDVREIGFDAALANFDRWAEQRGRAPERQRKRQNG